MPEKCQLSHNWIGLAIAVELRSVKGLETDPHCVAIAPIQGKTSAENKKLEVSLETAKNLTQARLFWCFDGDRPQEPSSLLLRARYRHL